jgi:hypothetical protein
MSQSFSRRDALKGLALAVGAAGALRSVREARADALPHLSPTDPTAQALGYHDDAKSVVPGLSDLEQARRATPACSRRVTPVTYRPCNIFPGKPSTPTVVQGLGEEGLTPR